MSQQVFPLHTTIRVAVSPGFLSTATSSRKSGNLTIQALSERLVLELRAAGMENYSSHVPAAIAKTKLANERTFLAWVRTSLKMFALGYAIAFAHTYFFPAETWMDRIIAVWFQMTGLAFFAYGVIRYNRMKEWIRSTQVDITCRNDDLPMKQVATVMSIILIAGIAHAIVKMEWWKE